MASKDYLKLCEEAQKKKLKLMKAQEKQIKLNKTKQHQSNNRTPQKMILKIKTLFSSVGPKFYMLM